MTKSLLLIDDEEIAYLLVKRHIELLNTPDITLEWAETPEEGVEFAQKGGWDLILVDLLFGNDYIGPKLISEIKKIVEGQNTRIMGITQFSLTTNQKRECIEAGAERVITKWPMRREMQTLLRDWLNLDDSTSPHLSKLESIRLQLKSLALQRRPLGA